MSFEFNSDVSRVVSSSNNFFKTEKASYLFEKLSNSLKISDEKDYSTEVEVSKSEERSKLKDYENSSEQAQSAINELSVANSALGEIKENLFSVKSLLSSISDDDDEGAKAEKQKEIDKNIENIDRIARETSFEDRKILDGSQEGKSYEVDESTSYQTEKAYKDASAASLGITSSDISTSENAEELSRQTDEAIEEVESRNAEISEAEEFFTKSINRNEVAAQNIVSAQSYASSMSYDTAKLLSEQVQEDIVGSSVSSLDAQANQSPNIAIDLL